MECFVIIGWPKNAENSLAPPRTEKVEMGRIGAKLDRYRKEWKYRRAVSAWIDGTSVKVDGEKGVDVGVIYYITHIRGKM